MGTINFVIDRLIIGALIIVGLGAIRVLFFRRSKEPLCCPNCGNKNIRRVFYYPLSSEKPSRITHLCGQCAYEWPKTKRKGFLRNRKEVALND
jgi:hypothetical protein